MISLKEKIRIFFGWVSNKTFKRRKLIIIVSVVLLLSAGSFIIYENKFSQNKLDSAKEVSKIETIKHLTKDSLNKNYIYSTEEKSENFENLKKSLEDRKKSLLEIAYDEKKIPAELTMLFIPDEARATIPENLKYLVEDKFSQKGKVTSVSTLKSDSSNEKTYDILQTESNEAYNLINLSGSDLNLNGTNQIDGFKIENTVFYTSISSVSESATVLQSPTQPSVTNKAAFIFFNFSDKRTEPFSPDQVKENFFTTNSSTNNYIKEASFGKVSFSGANNPEGDYYGWYNIDSTSEGCSVQNNFTKIMSWQNMARQMAIKDGFTESNYSNVLFFFPRSDCDFAGMAVVGGTVSTYNGRYDSFIMKHEIGHNFGFGESGIALCFDENEQLISMSNKCDFINFGNDQDVMGAASIGHYNAKFKQMAGWLPKENSVNVTKSGNYTLEPLEKATSGVQLINIAQNSTGGSLVHNKYYFIDFRQNYGFDNYEPNDPRVNGVAIYMISGDPDNPGKGYDSYLVNPELDTMGVRDNLLTVGKTFKDEVDGISIKLISITNGKAEIEVRMGDLVCDEDAYSHIPIYTSIEKMYMSYAEASQVYKVYVRNDNIANCEGTDFEAIQTVPEQWQSQFDVTSFSLKPGESIYLYLTVKPTPETPPDIYDIYVTIKKKGTDIVMSKTAAYYLIFIQSCSEIPHPTPSFSPSFFNAVDKPVEANFKFSLTDNRLPSCMKIPGYFIKPIMYEIEVSNLPAGWRYELSNPTFNEPGFEQNIMSVPYDDTSSVNFKLIPAADAKEGAYKIGIKVKVDVNVEVESSFSYLYGKAYQCTQNIHKVNLDKVDQFSNRADYYFTVTNADSATCGDSSFYAMSAGLTSAWSSSFQPQRLNLKPGASGSIKATVSHPLNASPSTHNFRFEILNFTTQAKVVKEATYSISEVAKCVKTNPRLNVSPSRATNLSPGNSVDYILTIENLNNSLCSSVNYQINVLNSSNITTVLSNSSISVFSGQRGAIKITATSSVNAPYNAGLGFTAKVFDKNDISFSSEIYGSYATMLRPVTVVPCTYKAPIVDLWFNSSVIPINVNEKMDYSVSIKNNDPTSCGPSEYTVKVYDFGPEIYQKNTTITLEPQKTLILNEGYTVSDKAPFGRNGLEAYVTSLRNASLKGEKYSTYYVNKPIYDPFNVFDSKYFGMTETCSKVDPVLTLPDYIPSVKIGRPFSIDVKLTNRNALNCNPTGYNMKYFVEMDGNPISGWKFEYTTPQKDIYLPSGESATFRITATSPLNLSNDVYDLNIYAISELQYNSKQGRQFYLSN